MSLWLVHKCNLNWFPSMCGTIFGYMRNHIKSCDEGIPRMTSFIGLHSQLLFFQWTILRYSKCFCLRKMTLSLIPNSVHAFDEIRTTWEF